MGLAPSQDGRTTVAQSPLPHCCTLNKASGLSVWEVEGIFLFFSLVLELGQAQCSLQTALSQPRKWAQGLH